MKKLSNEKEPVITSQREATEIIELALADLSTLTRAFQVIEAVCSEQQGNGITDAESNQDAAAGEEQDDVILH